MMKYCSVTVAFVLLLISTTLGQEAETTNGEQCVSGGPAEKSCAAPEKKAEESTEENNVWESLRKWMDDRFGHPFPVSDDEKLQRPVEIQKEKGEKTDGSDDRDSDPFPALHQEQEQMGFLTLFQSLLQAKGASVTPSSTSDSDSSSSRSVAALLETSRKLVMAKDKRRTFQEQMELFFESIKQVVQSLERSFAHHIDNLEKFNPLSFWYFVEHEDERKNPSWKRRKHRYMKPLSTDTVLELHDLLYLSHLSYADTEEDIRRGLSDFRNNTWELVYCKTEGFPSEPAHFLAIPRDALNHSDADFQWWQPPWQKQSHLEVLFIVRGTKELGDALSDGLLDTVDYRDGKAHAGIKEAGLYLSRLHSDTLQHLLNESGKDTVRLTLAGHSLGAAAAAIAAMELHHNDTAAASRSVQVSSVGFGCPALLSWNLSQSTQNYITTVVSDADIIPRTSGATLTNMLLDVLSYDWTAKGLEDFEDFLEFVNTQVPFDIPVESFIKWANQSMDRDDRPYFHRVPKERLDPVLYPPGNCIHLFRDGFGYTGTYTPCNFFKEVDVTRTLLDDHLIPPGYHRAFLQLMRDKLSDVHFDFPHNLMALPV